jgi:hypothetical protein
MAKAKHKKNHTKNYKKISKFLYWTPRILSILFLLFLAMFSLDVFGNGYSFWETVFGLFMHNIPVFILAGLLIISWKYEIVGGIAFILAGLAYIVLLFMNPKLEWYMLIWAITIAGPSFLVGVLFLLNWRNKKKRIKKFK